MGKVSGALPDGKGPGGERHKERGRVPHAPALFLRTGEILDPSFQDMAPLYGLQADGEGNPDGLSQFERLFSLSSGSLDFQVGGCVEILGKDDLGTGLEFDVGFRLGAGREVLLE